MFSSTTTRALSINAALLILAACGAGDGSQRAGEPQAPLDPALAHDYDHAQDRDDGPQAPQLHADAAVAKAQGAPSAPPVDVAPLPPVAEVVASTAAPAAAPVEAITLASVLTPLMPATYNVPPYWPVWWGTGKPVDGVNCLVSGKFHHHVLLSIYKDGKRLGFPDGVGRVHAGCYHAYEMHVHDASGVVHMESDVAKTFKLSQWFSLWGLGLSRTGTAGLAGPVRFYIVDKHQIKRYDGNPADIVMLPHREILIVSGTQIATVPNYQWPPGI
ncbi:hypothetical protein [Massilia genomosp. 1]|uniref:Uncharacterized protein n=1 Tax=Massilia genomosp. 1 TaxID=2609280 RepID=A0ABX0N380_9BURK|nr:hypothetical protein [Massilia genomosp. 1]NHZ66500.1 hypothetical protein [Massilia genomosp. 1]